MISGIDRQLLAGIVIAEDTYHPPFDLRLPRRIGQDLELLFPDCA